jgi:hypothetical protein
MPGPLSVPAAPRHSERALPLDAPVGPAHDGVRRARTGSRHQPCADGCWLVQVRGGRARNVARPRARHRRVAEVLGDRSELTEGESDREIAAELGISPRTVMRHVTGILNKLGVASRTAAATLAIRQHLV